MLRAIEGVKGRILVIGLALMTWALGQLWTTEMERLKTLEGAALAQAWPSTAGASSSVTRPET